MAEEATRLPVITDGRAIADIMAAEVSTSALALLMDTVTQATPMVPVTPTIPVIPTIQAILTARSPLRRPAPTALMIGTATGFPVPIAIPISSNIHSNMRRLKGNSSIRSNTSSLSSATIPISPSHIIHRENAVWVTAVATGLRVSGLSE